MTTTTTTTMTATTAATAQKLNIGLHVARGSDLPPLVVSRAVAEMMVAHRCGSLYRTRLAQSTTEPTLVVELPVAAPDATIHDLAIDLAQDCIAVRDATGGRLIGPRASRWGAFDPAFFIE
jgi:hypothetical protein